MGLVNPQFFRFLDLVKHRYAAFTGTALRVTGRIHAPVIPLLAH